MNPPSDIPTPRTTDKANEIRKSGTDWHASASHMVEHSKTLERELTIALQERDEWKNAFIKCEETKLLLHNAVHKSNQ